MRKTILIISLIFNTALAFGQSVKVLDGYIDQYPIQMFLNDDGVAVTGFYLYKKDGKPIQILGEHSQKQLQLTEQHDVKGISSSEPGGTFVLNEDYTGIWKTKDEELNVKLTETGSKIKWRNFKKKVELSYAFQNNKKRSYPIQISIQVPDSEQNGELMNLIVPEIFGITRKSYGSTWDYYDEYLAKNYTEYLNLGFVEESSQHFEPSLRFETNMSGRVVSIIDGILNYKTSRHGYAGGAHGYHVETYYVFDLNKMTTLKFEDIFKPNTKSKIANLLFEKDNKEHGLEGFERNIGNIYLTNKGVGFFFNPYQLDCYACGTFNYFLDFSELQGLLKE